MPRITACFKGIVQTPHDLNRFDVDRVLFGELVLLVAWDECKLTNLLVKVGQWKFDGLHAAAFKERQVALVFRFKIVEGDTGKVRNDDVARNFVCASLACQVLNVSEGLGFRLV